MRRKGSLIIDVSLNAVTFFSFKEKVWPLIAARVLPSPPPLSHVTPSHIGPLEFYRGIRNVHENTRARDGKHILCISLLTCTLCYPTGAPFGFA